MNSLNGSLALKNICVIRLSALGDCCHALAITQHLRNQLPQANITWIIGKTEYQLVDQITDIQFIVVDKSKLFKSLKQVFLALRHTTFDVVLNMHASMSANLVSLMVKSKRKIGYDKIRARDLQNLFCHESIPSESNQHVLDGMLEFPKFIGIDCNKPKWNLPICKKAEDTMRSHIKLDQITCVISPCSSQRYGDQYNRSWPIENYIEVIHHLIKIDTQVIITGGNTEIEKKYSEEISKTFPNQITNLIGKSFIKELAAIISLSDFIISPDSGPAHIATVTNTPVIGLYAMTNPLRSGPYNSQEWVISAYEESLNTFMSSNSENVKWGQKIKHPEAMSLILPKTVTHCIDQLIATL